MPKKGFISKSFKRDWFFKNELAKHKPLSREREAELSIRIQNGDIEARNELALSALLFMFKVAMQFYNRNFYKISCSEMEFISAGYEGLLAAADRFDGSQGVKFISYAVQGIRQKIMYMINENEFPIHVPANSYADVRAARSAQDQLSQERGLDISLDRATHEIDITNEAKDQALLVSRMHFVPVHSFLYVDGYNERLADFYGALVDGVFQDDVIEDPNSQTPEDAFFSVECCELIEAALELTCTNRESLIIRKYFGLNGNPDKKLDQIAKEIGLTRERIRQLKERALSKIRSVLSPDLEFFRKKKEAKSIILRNRRQRKELEEKREVVLELCAILEQELNRPPRPDEIAIETNGWITEEEIFEILKQS